MMRSTLIPAIWGTKLWTTIDFLAPECMYVPDFINLGQNKTGHIYPKKPYNFWGALNWNPSYSRIIIPFAQLVW